MKSLVREIFSFQRQAIDGICAAALHVTQSKNFTTYYCKRKRRLAGKAEQETSRDGIDEEAAESRDKFLEIYFADEMLSVEDQYFRIKKPQHGLDESMSASSGSEKRTTESEGHE